MCPVAQLVRVLVVDDQKIYRDTAQFVIDVSGEFEVVGLAESGEDGVEQAGLLRPDLVLMDINMPGIDGLEATRRLVAELPGTRVIVFSTHSAMEFEARAVAAGAIGFISKSELTPLLLKNVWSRGAQSSTK